MLAAAGVGPGSCSSEVPSGPRGPVCAQRFGACGPWVTEFGVCPCTYLHPFPVWIPVHGEPWVGTGDTDAHALSDSRYKPSRRAKGPGWGFCLPRSGRSPGGPAGRWALAKGDVAAPCAHTRSVLPLGYMQGRKGTLESRRWSCWPGARPPRVPSAALLLVLSCMGPWGPRGPCEQEARSFAF